MKFYVVKTPGGVYREPTWHYQCPLCKFGIWPNVMKNYVKDLVETHLVNDHLIDLGRVKLRVKKMTAAEQATHYFYAGGDETKPICAQPLDHNKWVKFRPNKGFVTCSYCKKTMFSLGSSIA